jgi:hypothetical protein
MITIMTVCELMRNGHPAGVSTLAKNKTVDAMSLADLVGAENGRNNAWNLRFADGNMNGNNNKSNSNVARAVAALDSVAIEGWIEALWDCERHKKGSAGRIKYCIGWDMDLLRLAREVESRTYRPSESECFLVTKPRLREVFAANFRDRVVQHWLCLRIEPLLEACFRDAGDVSYNCRSGYGTLRCIRDAAREADRVSDGYTKEAWYARFDIRGFFMAIDKEILLDSLLPMLCDMWHYWEGTAYERDLETVIWLTEVVVRHRPELLCHVKGDRERWAELPASKTLFAGDGTRGMAIGNLTSQLLANYYMTEWDAVAVRAAEMCGGAYLRFVDDFLFILPRKADALAMHRLAETWLRDRLRLTLHPDKVYIQEVKKGVQLVGGVIKPGRTYLINRTVAGFRKALRRLDNACIRGDDERARRHLRSVNSYMGFLRQHATYDIRRKAFAGLSEALWRRYSLAGDYHYLKPNDYVNNDQPSAGHRDARRSQVAHPSGAAPIYNRIRRRRKHRR